MVDLGVREGLTDGAVRAITEGTHGDPFALLGTASRVGCAHGDPYLQAQRPRHRADLGRWPQAR